jgi:hypothetical protein
VAKANKRLTSEQQVFIVESLACYRQLGEIKKDFKERFEQDITSQAIEAYDPSKYAGRNLSEKFRLLFAGARDAYLKDVASIPIKQQAYRFRMLQASLDKALLTNNLVLVNSILEQAAKEDGGAYTNKRQHSGPDGGSIPVKSEVTVTFVKAKPADALPRAA